MRARLTDVAQQWIAGALAPGGCALDATAGTGRDTLFLAHGVGVGGRVHAFDIQPQALARTRRRVTEAGLAPCLRLHACCHTRICDRTGTDRFCAAMFNLGWLPGGDEATVTRPQTTVAALTATARRLAPGGRLSVLAYRGHAGGAEEARAVAEWIATAQHGLVLQEQIESGSGDRPGPVFHALVCPES